ncbi:MAG: ferritin-like domain-containing protein, partial [Streptosporangiaceae bacterium]
AAGQHRGLRGGARRAAGAIMSGSSVGRAGGPAGALQEALAAQNAAIFGYGVAGAYMSGAQQSTATTFWNDHRSAGDTLAAMLRARGAPPAAAQASYKMPFAVHDRGQAVALALYLEDGVTAAYLGLVGAAGQASLRAFGAEAMQAAAVRATYWRGSALAFPGLPATR